MPNTSWPSAVAESIDAEVPPSSDQKDREQKILIVDDVETNRKVLLGILRNERCVLLTAEDGPQAIDIARRERPDLILLDIMMPGKDGYEVCVELKNDARTLHVPVLFLSALSEKANKIKGLELGAVDYITKPFDNAEVLARVRSHLKIRRLTGELLTINRELVTKQRSLDADLRAAGDIQAGQPVDEVGRRRDVCCRIARVRSSRQRGEAADRHRRGYR